MLPLIIAPNPILRAVAQPVGLPLGADIKLLAKDMVLAMQHYRGIGLAAPQVGHSVRLIVIATPDGPTAYANPEITKSSWGKVNMEEGCLSLPGVFGVVRRPERISVRYCDLNGERVSGELSGMMARVFQHEVDHLNGILFTDIAKSIEQGEELLSKYGAI